MAVVLLAAAGRPRGTVRWRRRSMLVSASLLIGVGLLVNGVLKEGWGRARPAAVQELGGPAVFAPAFRPSDQCRTNCSFVSGHAATGFALGAVGLLGAPSTRRRWLVAGLCAGLVVGLCRMSQGAHFLSDVLFSGLVMWAAHLVLRALWLHRRAWRLRRRTGAPAVWSVSRELPLAASTGEGPPVSR